MGGYVVDAFAALDAVGLGGNVNDRDSSSWK